MANTTINVAPRLTYQFTNQASQTASIVLGERSYSVKDYRSGCLVCRVDPGSTLPSGSFAAVYVKNIMISEEEPNTEFLAPGSYLAQTQILSGDTWPQLYTMGWYLGAGAMVQVQLQVTYGSLSSGTAKLIMGVDLVLRDE